MTKPAFADKSSATDAKLLAAFKAQLKKENEL